MEVYSYGLPQDYVIPHQPCDDCKCQDYGFLSGCQNSEKLCDGIEGPSWLCDFYPAVETESYLPKIDSQCSTCDESCSKCENTITTSCSNCISCSSLCSEVTCSSCTCTCSHSRSLEILNVENKSIKPSNLIMTPSIKTSSSSISSFGKKLKDKLKDTTNHFFRNKSESIIRNTESNVISQCNEDKSRSDKSKQTSSDCLIRDSSDVSSSFSTSEVNSLQPSSKIDELEYERSKIHDGINKIDVCDKNSIVSSKKSILPKYSSQFVLGETIQEVPDDFLIDDYDDADSNFTDIPLDESVASNSINVKDVKQKKKPCLYSIMLGLYKEESWRVHGNDDLKRMISDIDQRLSQDRMGSKNFSFHPRNSDFTPQLADLYLDEEIEESTSTKKYPIELDRVRYEEIKKHGKAQEDIDKTISKMKRWEVILYKKLGFIKIVNKR